MTRREACVCFAACPSAAALAAGEELSAEQVEFLRSGPSAGTREAATHTRPPPGLMRLFSAVGLTRSASEDDFGVEAAAAGREEGVQVSVRRLLPGADGGVHQEMVSDFLLLFI